MHHDIQIASSTYDPTTPSEATFIVSYTDDEGFQLRVPAAGINGLLMVVAKIVDPFGIGAKGVIIDPRGDDPTYIGLAIIDDDKARLQEALK